MKPESRFWQEVKKNTPNIEWTRLESWASHGLPDLLGYNNFCGFFMVELKVVSKGKPRFSPHQIMFHTTRTVRNFILLKTLAPRSIKLYESSALNGSGKLVRDPLVVDNWSHIQSHLIHGYDHPLDA